MRFRYPLVLLALVPATALAWGDGCKLRADRAGGIEAAGVEKVVIRAGAGDMKVVGRGNAVRIEARGVACAAKQELLDATQISVRREGNVVYVETTLPQDDGKLVMGRQRIRLHRHRHRAAVEHSRGSHRLERRRRPSRTSRRSRCRTAPATSNLKRIAGLADVGDSSGDIEIESAGSVRLRDSSGDIDVEEVRGEVDVMLDSSGDIEIAQVDGNVKVEQDSSGGIRVENVKGNVNVDSDSSGDIYAGSVSGDFTVSEDSSGSIEHESIGGRVNVPNNKRDDDDDVE